MEEYVEFYILDVETKSYFRKRMVQYEMDQETVFFHFFMFVFGCCIYALARVWRLSGCIKENECTTNGCTDTGKRGLHDTG